MKSASLTGNPELPWGYARHGYFDPPITQVETLCQELGRGAIRVDEFDPRTVRDVSGCVRGVPINYAIGQNVTRSLSMLGLTM